MTPAQRAMALELAATGKSHRAIGKAVGLSHVTVGTFLRAQRDPNGAAAALNPGYTTAVAAPAPASVPLFQGKSTAEMLASLKPSHRPAEPDAAASLDESADALTITRELLTDARRELARAQAVGNSLVAQRYSRNAAALARALADLERRSVDDSDVLRVSRSEITAAMSRVRERVRKLAERPLLCQDCGRALSVMLGTEGLTHGSGE